MGWHRAIKKTIYTLNIGDYAPEITALTYPLMEAYAKKIGAEFYIIRERKLPEWDIDFEKMQIFELGRQMGNDWNIFFDSDTLIHPDLMDITQHLPKDTVAQNDHDIADNRFVYDAYFLRDGRHIGSAGWFNIASDWCLDLWHPLEDLTPEEAYSRIHLTQLEANGGIFDKRHLITDYALSRNIARFGLKYTTLRKILQELGYQNPLFLWHMYNVSDEAKLEMMKGILRTWGVLK